MDRSLHFVAQYIFAMDVGLVAGLAMQLGYWQRRYPQVAGSRSTLTITSPTDGRIFDPVSPGSRRGNNLDSVAAPFAPS